MDVLGVLLGLRKVEGLVLVDLLRGHGSGLHCILKLLLQLVHFPKEIKIPKSSMCESEIDTIFGMQSRSV